MTAKNIANNTRRLDLHRYFSYNGEKYTNHPNSVSDHYKTSLGNIENQILAIGDTNNNKVELFDIKSNAWTTKTSFSFCSSS